MNHLRRIILVVAACICMAATANSQLRYGFRVGGVFADATLKNAGDYSLSNKSGVSAGLMLEYQLPTGGFAADIAVLYTRFNNRLLLDGEKLPSFGRNFLEIPLHLKYKFWLHHFHDLVAPLSTRVRQLCCALTMAMPCPCQPTLSSRDGM